MPYTALDPATAAAAPVSTIGNPKTSVGETLLSLRDELAALIGGRADIATVRLDRWVNFGYVDVATSLELEELQGSLAIPTVVNQPLYTLPDNVLATLGVALVDTATYEQGGRPLEKIDLATFRRLALATGDLNRYFRHNDLLVVWPTPTQILSVTVDFRIRPRKLTAVTDSPILGYEWHEAILLAARFRAFEALLEFDKAALAKNSYIGYIRSRVNTKAEERTDQFAGVRPAFQEADLHQLNPTTNPAI